MDEVEGEILLLFFIILGNLIVNKFLLVIVIIDYFLVNSFLRGKW